jgi:hypothetical protein
MTSQIAVSAEASNNPPAVDCRVYERRPCALPTTCQPASVSEMNELRWSASIWDISQGGILVHLPRRFEKGTGLAIELPGDEARESSVVFVKVVHVKASEQGGWALGCKFVSELSEDELQRLLTSTHPVLSSSKKQYHEQEVQEEDGDAV